MPTFKVKVTAELELTPEIAAKWFCELDSDQQTAFLEQIYKVSLLWRSPASFQWQFIADDLAKPDLLPVKEMIREWIADVGPSDPSDVWEGQDDA